MQIAIKGRNVPVTDDIRAHARRRLSKVERQVSELARLEIEIYRERNPRVSDCQVAEATLHCFRRVVPAAVPGVVFLSGGQSDELATAHLSKMNELGGGPWELSFSYGRALQAPALKAWGGKPENVAAGQKAYYHRAKLNSAARYGKYTPAMEKAA